MLQQESDVSDSDSVAMEASKNGPRKWVILPPKPTAGFAAACVASACDDESESNLIATEARKMVLASGLWYLASRLESRLLKSRLLALRARVMKGRDQ